MRYEKRATTPRLSDASSNHRRLFLLLLSGGNSLVEQEMERTVMARTAREEEMRQSFREARALRGLALRMMGRDDEAAEVERFPVPEFRWIK